MNFKRIIASFALALAFFTLPAMGVSNLSYVAGRFVASQYANWAAVAQVYTGNATTGSSTITVRGGYIVLTDGRQIVPFAVGVPFVINDANPELVTPTAVSGCYKSQGMNQDGVLVTCTVTASFTYVHGAYAGLTSATGGVAEAVSDAFSKGGGVVVLDDAWVLNTSCTSCYASKAAMLAALLPYSTVVIEDTSEPGTTQFYAARPTGTTPLAAGSALVLTAATGSLTSGTYYAKYEYVDINGQLGKSSTESAHTGTITGFTAPAPAASTGAVGYVVFITSNGGAVKTEIQLPVTSANCTLTKLETVIPACAVTNALYGQTGSAFSTASSATPSGTAYAFGNTNLTAANDTGYTGSSTTAAYVPVTSNTAYLPFSPVITGGATAAASNSTYEIASYNLSAGILNAQDREWELCLGGHMLLAANSETLQLNIAYGPYDNSDVVVWTITTGAYSTTNEGVFHGCVELTTLTTGALGSTSGHGAFQTNLAGGATVTTYTEGALGSNTATGIATSLLLSTQQQLRVEAVIGTGAFGTGGVIFDSISLVPLN
jgi:hypothetical protein